MLSCAAAGKSTHIVASAETDSAALSAAVLCCVPLRCHAVCCAGNPIKFGLGLVSIGFDIVFMLQHYVWFHPDKVEQKDRLVQWQQQQQMLLHQVLSQQQQLLEQQQQILQQQRQDAEQRPLLGEEVPR